MSLNMRELLYFVIFSATHLFTTVRGSCAGYGLLRASSNQTDRAATYCIAYNPCFHELPKQEHQAKHLALRDVRPSKLCDDPGPTVDYQGAAVSASRHNCTFSQKAYNVQNHNGTALLVISNGIVLPAANQSSDYAVINISVAVMDSGDFVEMKKGLGQDISVWMYAPDPPRVDYNLIVIWLLAVFSVTVGGFWSGRLKHKEYMQILREHRAADEEAGSPSNKEAAAQKEQNSVSLTAKFVLIFVALMCGLLVALYFWYNYVVYVVIALFVVAASLALYHCSKPLLRYLPSFTECRIPENNLPVLKHRPLIRKILLALVCIGIAVWWAVERNKWYAWILQDILGVIFCIHLMKVIRLPSLKVCTIFLVLLFVYDVFFVFITPLFTKSGRSIMVDVATGGSGSSKEQLPMVLKMPRFSESISSFCGNPYSLLGFGDIIIPGLLIAYCHGFDLKVQSKRIYFISTVLAYGLGLIITFIALAFMQTGQPALLYLVPCTLLTVVAIGACRRELRHLWSGEKKEEAPEQQRTSSTLPEEPDYGTTTTTSEGNQPGETQATDNASSADPVNCNDTRLLINR